MLATHVVTVRWSLLVRLMLAQQHHLLFNEMAGTKTSIK